MKEEYLHFIFKQKLLGDQFICSKGNQLDILNFGEHNDNAGPDFLNASIMYDKRRWIGSIEFHVNASDWIKHNHQQDENYRNVIAHFVHNNDYQVKIDDFVIPTVELKKTIDKNHFKNYKQIIQAKSWIPCETLIHIATKEIIKQEFRSRIEGRLQRKSIEIIETISHYNGDRRRALYQIIGKAFLGNINSLPFENLFQKLNMNWLQKLNYDPFRIESLVLGTAGFLEAPTEENYVKGLQREFQYLKHMFDIQVIDVFQWKFARMRPSNFPEIRLAQFASFLAQNVQISDLTKFQYNWKVELNQFWKNHFRLNRRTKLKRTNLSNNRIDLITINAIIPFVYTIGSIEKNTQIKIKAIESLHKISPEKNQVIKKWNEIGIKAHSAFDSQSLLELKKEGCNRKKCLFCAIGKNVLRK